MNHHINASEATSVDTTQNVEQSDGTTQNAMQLFENRAECSDENTSRNTSQSQSIATANQLIGVSLCESIRYSLTFTK